MSGDGSDIYFCVSDPSVTGIFVTKLLDGRWTEPVIAPFSGKGFFDFEPHISPDGKKFFFLSNRPPHYKPPKDGWFYQNIWMMHKTESGWSEPLLVDKLAADSLNSFFPSVTEENILYFTRDQKNSKTRIYKSRFENNSFEEPVIVPLDVPEEAMLFNAYVSPEEDFLITCGLNIDSSNINQDYYISFKTTDGVWGKLIKFGPEINFPGDNANSAFVSPDGKYLFFNSSRKDPLIQHPESGTTLREIVNSKTYPGYGSSAIFWVDAKIIEDLKPANLKKQTQDLK
jgi:hypothetical protein